MDSKTMLAIGLLLVVTRYFIKATLLLAALINPKVEEGLFVPTLLQVARVAMIIGTGIIVFLLLTNSGVVFNA